MSYARVQPLLPLTIEELIGLDPPDEWERDTRVQTTGSVRRIPTPSAIVRAAAVRPPPIPSVRVPTLRQAPTVASFRTTAARKMTWPIFVCGFIAGIAGGMALLKSPVGQKPAVQHVVKQAAAIMHVR